MLMKLVPKRLLWTTLIRLGQQMLMMLALGACCGKTFVKSWPAERPGLLDCHGAAMRSAHRFFLHAKRSLGWLGSENENPKIWANEQLALHRRDPGPRA